MFELPVCAIGAMLGIPKTDWLSLAPEVSAFVSGIAPIATAERNIVGNCAAKGLSRRLEETTSQKQHTGVFLDAFTKACTEKGMGRNSIAANTVGFLFQTYEATAGLIGNSTPACETLRSHRRRKEIRPTASRHFRANQWLLLWAEKHRLYRQMDRTNDGRAKCPGRGRLYLQDPEPCIVGRTLRCS